MLEEVLTFESGIGLETTILFAREGANILMADISAPALAKGKAKVLELYPNTQHIETVICDVTKEADIEALVARTEEWGGLDVMFNNAGIMHADDADAIDTPEKIWDLTMSINVKGVWFGCKHAIKSMRKYGKKTGSVINVASVVALVGSATPQLAYTASKGAVLALTRELAIVHAREGFRFNALCPAPLKYVLIQVILTTEHITNKSIAHHYSRTGSVMMPLNVLAVKSTSQLVGSAKLSSKPMLFYSSLATKAASSPVLTSLWTVA
jgi:NAD(P)-dependent dehydrogenase (short-subunit alcohol dehydrogenase family)